MKRFIHLIFIVIFILSSINVVGSIDASSHYGIGPNGWTGLRTTMRFTSGGNEKVYSGPSVAYSPDNQKPTQTTSSICFDDDGGGGCAV